MKMKDWRFPGLLAILVVMTVLLGVMTIRLKQSDESIETLQAQNAALTKTVVLMTKEVGRLTEVVKSHEKRIQKWEALTSWYGPGFHGRTTASGTKFDQNAYTCAHKTLPFGTVLVLENPQTKRRVTCVVTDRGPYIRGRSLDVSYRVAQELGMVREGVRNIVVNQVTL